MGVETRLHRWPREIVEEESVLPGDRVEITNVENGDVHIITVQGRLIRDHQKNSYRLLYRPPTVNIEESTLLENYRTLTESDRALVRQLIHRLG